MHFLNSLFIKTFLIITSILSIGTFLFMFSIILNQKNSLYNGIYSQAKTIASSIELITADAMLTDDYSFIVEHTLKVLKANENLEYILITKRNDLTIFVDKTQWKLLEELPLEIQKSTTNRIHDEIIPNSFSKDHDKIFNFCYPIAFSGVSWGWIDIALSLEDYKKQIDTIYINSFFTFFLILLSSITFSYLFTKWLVKPIESLTDASKKVSLGEFDLTIQTTRKDEIGTLSKNFNLMVSRLQQYTQQLENSKEDLEKRVEERTKELQLLNEELDNRVRSESLKRADQERIMIQQSRQAAMGEMIGNIAHQWRQPLNALGLLLQNIENAYEMDMIDKKFIDRTVTKGNLLTNNMSKTIDDFRNFFKPNKLQEEFSFQNAYFETKDIVSSGFQNNSIELIEQIDETVNIIGYSNEFSQVILNLLNNAKDALLEINPSTKQVEIHIYQDEKNSYFKLSDNAGGIPKDIIDKIFDPYFSTKEEGKGTGIGLYMSKMIIESHMQGNLEVTNSNKGAVFTITVPKKDMAK